LKARVDGAIIMCGGKGTRLGNVDKGCVRFGGKPVALRVVEAVKRNGLPAVFAFTVFTACSAAYAGEGGASLLQTPGKGYVEDLRWAARWALEHLSWRKALILSCDVPLLNKAVVAALLELSELPKAPWLSVVVSGEELRKLGFKVEGEKVNSSISIVDLEALSRAGVEEVIPYADIAYSPAEDVWDYDTEEDLEVFESIWSRRSKGTTS